jgi:hypothetical protein
MLPSGSTERAFVVGCGVNGGLGAALGGLMSGLPGVQLGLVAGLLIAILPMASRGAWRRLVRPRGLPRFLATRVAAQSIAAGRAVAAAIGSLTGPIARLMWPPALIAGFLADLAANAVAGLLGRLWRLVATPLGLANIAAAAVVGANLAGMDSAAPAGFLALGMLLLVLIVSENEAAAGQIPAEDVRDG